MAIPLLICDDSNMARRQLQSSLPDGWEVDITFATSGADGLEAIRQGRGDLVFLDLTMPDMSGYDVLEVIKEEGLKCMVIVVSGDIQPAALERAKTLGALDFIKKPLSSDRLLEVLQKYGLL